MGVLRRAGVITESTAAPRITNSGGGKRPDRLFAPDGVTIKDLDLIEDLTAGFITAGHQRDSADGAVPGQEDGDVFEFDIYAKGNETRLTIGTMKTAFSARFDVYVNGMLEPVYSAMGTGSNKFYIDDGGVFTDDSTDAGSAAAGDVPLMPAVEVANDAVYFGCGGKFRGIRINIATPGVGSAIAWEYYNGATWAALTVVDGTSGFTAAAGNHDVTFTPPSDWAQVDPGAAATETLYYVRARVTSASFTTVPVATQIWLEGGYDDYAAADTQANRYITLTNTINPGHNVITMKVNGRHFSNSASDHFFLLIGGISVQ